MPTIDVAATGANIRLVVAVAQKGAQCRRAVARANCRELGEHGVDVVVVIDIDILCLLLMTEACEEIVDDQRDDGNKTRRGRNDIVFLRNICLIIHVINKYVLTSHF